MMTPRFNLVLALSSIFGAIPLFATKGGTPPEARDRAGSGNLSRARRPTERQAVNVFRAYDKNRDWSVTADEWLVMRHLSPNDTSERARGERMRFQAAGPGADGRMNQKAFVFWYTQGRFNQLGEGGGRAAEGAVRRGPRDGEGAATKGPRDGEGKVRQVPRDSGDPSLEAGVITVNADANGPMLGGGNRPLEAAQMQSELRRIAATANRRKVMIRAERAMSAAALQTLVRECQAAGIKNLFISTR